MEVLFFQNWKKNQRDGWEPSMFINTPHVLKHFYVIITIFQVWSSYVYSRCGQSSLTGRWYVSQWAWILILKHVQFRVLPTLLKMDDPCNAQHPCTRKLLPCSNFSDLFNFREITLEHPLANQNIIKQDLNLLIL